MIPARLTPDPLSVKAILRLENSAMGGAIRADMTRKIDDCLYLLWLEAIADTGDVEQAAVMCWRIVSKDPNYKHPYWLELAFRRHGRAIIAAHHEGQFRH